MTGSQQPLLIRSLTRPVRDTMNERVWPYHSPTKGASDTLPDGVLVGFGVGRGVARCVPEGARDDGVPAGTDGVPAGDDGVPAGTVVVVGTEDGGRDEVDAPTATVAPGAGLGEDEHPADPRTRTVTSDGTRSDRRPTVPPLDTACAQKTRQSPAGCVRARAGMRTSPRARSSAAGHAPPPRTEETPCAPAA